MTAPSEAGDLAAQGYRVAELHVALATTVRALSFAVQTLSAQHATAVQIRQVRVVLAEALREVSR